MRHKLHNASLIVVRNSPIQGKGVFAARNISAGERIVAMTGRSVKYKEYAKEYAKGNKRVSCDPFQIGVFSYITLHATQNKINHSCNPNTAVHGVRVLIARRDIKKGEEIT